MKRTFNKPQQHKCRKCNHTWVQRKKGETLPVRCPACVSPMWWVPRRDAA